VFEDGYPSLVAAALGDVARAKGMAQIAKAAGLGRESLCKALSPEGNPEFATVLKVMRALGLKLKVAHNAHWPIDVECIVGNEVERLRAEFTATSGRREDLIDQLIVFSFERVNESDTLQCETILQIFGK
jgi:probable addiction module antidote protein